jgi:hypothetical protein
LEGSFAFAELGGARAELVEGDELLLVAVEQSPEGALRVCEVALQRVTLACGGVCLAECGEPPVDFGFDQARVLEQVEYAGPDELVDLGQADGPVPADTSFGAAVPVGA